MNFDQKELPPLEEISMAKRLWLLFFIFAKIAAFVVGGGYVILPMVEQELVQRRKWIKPEEFVDMTAVVQTIPGIIAGNSAIYLGYRVAGMRGALAALIGVATPSVIIITVIAICFNMISREAMATPWVQGAFIGVKSAVCGMVLATAIKMAKKIFTGAFEITVGVCAFIAVTFFPVNPGIAMVIGAVIGVIYFALRFKFLSGSGEAVK